MLATRQFTSIEEKEECFKCNDTTQWTIRCIEDVTEMSPPNTLWRCHEDVWIRKKCYIGKTSLFGFPKHVEDVFVWFSKRVEDTD